MEYLKNLSKRLFWGKTDVSLLSISLSMAVAILGVKYLREYGVLFTEATKSNDIALAGGIVFIFILIGSFSKTDDRENGNADS